MRPVAPSPDPDQRSGPAATGNAPATTLDPARLRDLSWWSTVGVAWGIGAALLVAIVITERDPLVAVVASLGTATATVAAARLLALRLPGRDDGTGPIDQVPWLVAAAVGGAIAALAAAQWAGTVMGAVVPGVATAAVAVQVPARRRSTVLGAGAVTTVVVVQVARRIAAGQVDATDLANQVLLVIAVAGGLVVARWFWQLIHHLERTRRLEAELAVADERLRFAADLHDVQGHHLQVIALQSELATRLAPTDPDAAATQMREVHEHARTALAETRDVVQGYRRTPLGDELANATRVLEAAGIDGRLEHGTTTDAAEVAEPGRQLLGLVVREATTNILRHSNARRARLALDVDGHDAHLQVHNDGADDGPDHTPGTGMTGLADRLADAGGQLHWDRADGWFTVTARVPTNADGAA